MHSKKTLSKLNAGDVHIDLKEKNRLDLTRVGHDLASLLNKPVKDVETGEMQEQVPINIKHPYTITVMLLPESQAFLDKRNADAAAQNIADTEENPVQKNTKARSAVQLAQVLSTQVSSYLLADIIGCVYFWSGLSLCCVYMLVFRQMIL